MLTMCRRPAIAIRYFGASNLPIYRAQILIRSKNPGS